MGPRDHNNKRDESRLCPGGGVVGTAGTRSEIALYGQMADAAGQSNNKRTNVNLWWQLSDSDGEVIVGAIDIGVGMARG